MTKILNSTFLLSPWKAPKKQKPIAWAAFLFFFWISVPALAIKKLVKVIHARGKIDQAFQDKISKQLATLNNSSVQNEVNGIYITTNETGIKKTRAILKSHPLPQVKKIHIGCAAWHNFDIACERKSDYLLLFDFNPKNAEFIKITLKFIKESTTREDFTNRMLTYLESLSEANKKLYFHPDLPMPLKEKILKELNREGSFLSCNETYQYIRELAFKDRIVYATETVTHSAAFQKLRATIDTHHLAIDTVYLSNICNFMSTEAMQSAYADTIKQLVMPQTMVIHCPKIPQSGNKAARILKQSVIIGNDILKAASSSALFQQKESAG